MRDTAQYMVAGQRVPSVTEALDLAGLVDFSDVPPDRLEWARARGQDIHGWTAIIDEGYAGDESPPWDITGYVDAYLRFKNESGFAPELIEHVVINETYHYAGQLDRTGKLNGKKALVDIKAVAKVGPATSLQTKAYALCLDEPHNRYALQLKPDGTYRLHSYPLKGRTESVDRDDWYAALRMAYWKLTYMGETLE
jgi:hypothetical protein